jgi:hypothetical protein
MSDRLYVAYSASGYVRLISHQLAVLFSTTRNYLICDAFSATFSENVTNVHCSLKHCDDFFNSSRFYDVFLFFVTDVHWSPKHCDDLLNSSRFYDIFLFSSRMYIDGYLSPKHHYDLLNSSQSDPQHCDVWADSSQAVNKNNHVMNRKNWYAKLKKTKKIRW